MDLNNLSANWRKLQASGAQKKSAEEVKKPAHGLKRKRSQSTAAKSLPTPLLASSQKPRSRYTQQYRMEGVAGAPKDEAVSPTANINSGWVRDVEIGKYIALDCEMVGVGPEPHLNSALARVSIVNYNGEQIYDSYVRPKEPVTDWRTPVSGIAPRHMRDARTLQEVQQEVSEIITGRVVVGHSLRRDFEVLFLDHPKRDVRDTSKYPPYKKWAGGTPKLKLLSSELLGLDIQQGEHSSVEDARACMLLFRRDKDGFEREQAKRWPPQRAIQTTNGGRKKKKKH